MFFRRRERTTARMAALEKLTEAITFNKELSYIQGLADMAYELGTISKKEVNDCIKEANNRIANTNKEQG